MRMCGLLEAYEMQVSQLFKKQLWKQSFHFSIVTINAFCYSSGFSPAVMKSKVLIHFFWSPTGRRRTLIFKYLCASSQHVLMEWIYDLRLSGAADGWLWHRALLTGGPDIRHGWREALPSCTADERLWHCVATDRMKEFRTEMYANFRLVHYWKTQF